MGILNRKSNYGFPNCHARCRRQLPNRLLDCLPHPRYHLLGLCPLDVHPHGCLVRPALRLQCHHHPLLLDLASFQLCRHADSKKLNGWFYGFIVASNIYTWFLTFINIIWLFIMWLWAAVLHDFVAGEEKPSTAFAWIGMLLATTIQILYTWSSKRSMKMVRCWWKGGLETGGEYCSRFADY